MNAKGMDAAQEISRIRWQQPGPSSVPIPALAPLRMAQPREKLLQLIHVSVGHKRSGVLFDCLMSHGTRDDWRKPVVVRLSPAPLHNRFADCLAFAEAVLSVLHR